MKMLYFISIFVFLTLHVNAETFFCIYKDSEVSKTIKFDRTSHSHFKKCQNYKCNKRGLAVIYVDNNNLIFGDIFQNKMNIEYFQIFFINKKLNIFKGLKISMPGSDLGSELIEGVCLK